MRGPLSAALCVAALGLGAHAAVVNKNPDPATYAERLRFGEDISLTATGATTATSILTAVTPVYGHPLCDYSAAINYSGKRYLLTIDTGSSNNAVASTTCTTCGPGSSFTVSQTNLKPYTAYYGTAAFSTSWTGALVSGQASVAGLGSLTQMPFSSDVSAILSQNNFFRQSCFGYTNGILGLAYAGVSQFGSVSFVDTLTTNNVPNGFALQLCNPTYPLSPQQQTGNWWIGGYSTKYMTSAMQFTPITEELWYGVNLLGISVAGKSVETEDLSKPRAIIDSGTNVLLFSDENYEEVVEALVAAKAVTFASSISSSLQSAFWKGSQLSLPANSFALNPKATINLKLAGMANGSSVNLPISPTEYVTAYGPDARGFMNISLAIAASGGGGQLATIIGLPAHINKMIFYDRGNKRIGFASSACNMTGPFGGLKPALATDLNVLAPLPIPKDVTPMSGDSPRSPTSAIGTQMSSSAEVLRSTRIAAATALIGSLLLAHRI